MCKCTTCNKTVLKVGKVYNENEFCLCPVKDNEQFDLPKFCNLVRRNGSLEVRKEVPSIGWVGTPIQAVWSGTLRLSSLSDLVIEVAGKYSYREVVEELWEVYCTIERNWTTDSSLEEKDVGYELTDFRQTANPGRRCFSCFFYEEDKCTVPDKFNNECSSKRYIWERKMNGN